MKKIIVIGMFVLMIAMFAGFQILAFALQPNQQALTNTPEITNTPQITSTPEITNTPEGTYTPQPDFDGTFFYSCVDSSRYQTGDYLILNNQWNNGLMGPNDVFQQCMQVNSIENPFNVEWSWVWPELEGSVKAFPEIIYGWAPWLQSSTTSYLPAQLSVLSKTISFQVDFDTYVWTDPTAIYNIAFDMFVTSSEIPTPETRTHEIMIWLHDQNPWVSTDSTSYVERLTISDEEYDLWVTKGSTQTIIVFRKVRPALKGSIVINHFLDYLLDNGYLPGDGYLADIEFGNEIIGGAGRTFIHNYSITPSDVVSYK